MSIIIVYLSARSNYKKTKLTLLIKQYQCLNCKKVVKKKVIPSMGPGKCAAVLSYAALKEFIFTASVPKED